MNKIYKVIWSKVKNQYVVVSELAHSNGKQSRTSRNSIRSRIAALVVCGAITAFGVYGALPNSVYAENNTKAWQYAAISIEANPDFGEYRDEYHLENVQVNGKSKTYWVRDGYHIDVEQVHRYDSDDTTNVSGTPTPMPVYDDVIRVYRNDDWEESNANGLLSSMKVSNSNMGITTLNGKDLQDITAGTFVGASSGGGTEVPSNYNYLINDNGKWVDAGNEKFEDYFKTVTYDNTLGGYTYNNQLVDPQNVYFIDGQAGVFLVSGVNGEKEVYKGAVYGAYNEILVTGKDSNGNYYSYWGAERTDPNETIGDKLTVGQYNNTISWLNDNIRDIHEDDIKQIQVKATDNGGTIGLQTNGEADSKGNPTGGKNIPGTITIKNPTIDSGTNGKDVKIQFGSIGEDGKTDVAKFTVDAGSKVEGLNGTETATDGDTLTGLKINGVEYDLSQGKTYSPGQGIVINDDDNKISVNAGNGLEFTSQEDGEKLKVNANEDKGITVDGSGVAVNAGDGLTFGTQEGEDKGKLKVNVGKGLSINDSNQIVNNLEVTKATQNPDDLNKEHSDGGNWTITDSKADITLKNTTLVNGPVERQTISGVDNEYGGNYSVKDTDGNTVTLSDVASATKLQSIDNTKIGDLQYSGVTGTEVTNNDSLTTAVGKLDNAVEEATTEAGKHASVSVGDNLSVDSSKTNTNGGIDYHVTLDDTLYLGGEHTAENSKITLDGETGTAIIGNSTSGKATIGGVNITTTTADGNTSSTIGGLTNKEWNAESITSGQAATEDQLKKAINTVSGNIKTYSAGDGITIATDDNNKISVNAGDGLTFGTEETGDKGQLKVNVGKGLSINDSNQIVNNLEVTKATQNPNDSNEEHSDGGNWTITDSKANVTLKNTTLVNETAERQEMQGINEEYGGTYSVKDTDGNTVTLSDVASATKLQSIDNTKIGDLQYSGVTGTEVTNNDSLTTAVGKLDNAVEEATTEAGKHASVSVGDNLSVDSSKTNTNGGIDYHVTLDDTLYLGGEHTAENSKITLDGETGTAIIGNSTNGKATIGGVNITTTTTGESTSSTVTGLTNTTLGDDAPNSTFAKVGRAATEEQLQKAMTKIDEASYKGWNVTTNKGTKTAEVASNGNVDFSNTDGNIIVGQTGTNLTFDLNDNITLGDESGTRIQLNGNSQKDSMISITNKDSDTVFNIAKDGTVHSDGDIVAKADSNKKYSLSEVGENAVRYNENKSTVALAGTNGTTITNVADGDVSEGSKEAVNGSQLYATNQKVDAGWVATDGTNKIEVNPTDSGTTTLNFAGDNNITVTADTTNKAIQVALNDKVYLGGDHTEDSRNIVLDGERGVIGLGSNIALDGRDGTAVIGGVNITTTAEEGTGKHVATINGLSNTTWTGTTETPNRAATEGQLEDLSDTVNTGWYVADKNTAEDSTTGNFAVKPGETLTFNGDDNIDVEAKDHEVNVSLNDNITLGEGNSQININGNPENGEAALSIGDKFVVEQNGSVSIKADNTETYGTDTTVTINPDGVKFEKYGNGTTVINGQTIQAGGVVINGEDNGVYKGTITGLTNTTLDDETFATVGRAATEEQLKQAAAASKTTVSDGKNTTVTSNTDTDDGHVDYQVNLNDNITLGEGNNQININGAPEGDEPALSIGDKFVVEQNGSVSIKADNTETYGTDTTVTINPDGVKFEKYGNGTTVINGQTIQAGGVVINGEDNGVYKGTITGLTNTTLDDETFATVGRAATEEQLKQAAAASKTTISDGKNTTVTSTEEADGHIDYKVNLNDNITLGEEGDNQININGAPEAGEAALSIGDKFVVEQNGSVSIKADNTETYGTDTTVTINPDGVKFEKYGNGTTVINGQTIQAGGVVINGEDNGVYKGTITGLTNTTLDDETFATVGRAATEEQLKQAAAASKTTLSNGTNTNVTSTEKADGHIDYQVNLNKNINLNDRVYINGDPAEGNKTIVDIKSSDKSKEESIFAVEDKGNGSISIGGIDITNVDGPYLAVGDGKLKFYKDGGLSTGNATGTFSVRPDGDLEISGKNSSFNVDAETGNIYAANNSGSAIMMNDDSVALNAGGNGIVASDEGILLNTNGINEDIKLVTKGTSVSVDSNGTTFTNTNTNETTNINGGTINVGDKLMVEEDGSIYATNNNGSTVMINDNGVALNSEGNGVVVSGEGITLNTNGSAVTVDRFNGTTFTNTNTGETTNINGGTITTNTVKGLSNTTWDDELAKQVANSEELQGTAATQGQLQQAVSAVATEAAKQHTTVSGDDNLTVTSKENTNGGTNYQVTLNDDITLGNPKAGNTEGERSFTINTTDPEGYVPDSYKEEDSSGAEFIKENGGFMLFATDTQGHGIFGVTAKGSAWAKDFKTYTTDIYGNKTQYSLNEIGDVVAHMSSYYNEENGKSYTVFSRYLNEAEKDNPFVTVDENATRDIPLALRDDGAVLIGATIKGEDFTDNGIRINAETETTYDEDGNEVTNNIATITGLENTEWKPPTPVATFAANDINTTSRAATEAQLDDLYSAVAAYDVNVDGTIDYSHIALAGAPYGASRAGNGTPTGGTSITNVAYASGKDGSEAVNVDYLNDAINNAVKDGGAISDSDRHLQEGTYHVNDQGKVELIVADEKGENQSTVTIDNIANKNDITNLDNKIDNTFNDLNDKINNIDNVETDVKGGNINEDGTISLKTENEDGTTTNVTLKGQLTDSGVVQEGTTFDKETGTLTITSQDKYSGETSSVKVEGIASTEVVGATTKEDLATAYKDADKDGNATTEYITDSESMVEADVALDHAIQDVAGTSYANDMVLSNRIDSVEKRLGNVEERIDKVGAMAAAIANLRTMGFDPEAPTEIAIGVGQYKSETGIAIGVFHYPNQDFMLSASLSSSGDELMGGIGATWKLGRKSASERAKDEEARHLEQAEEMKKLAQQEKVKAQAQRHAKLLAERQQASQKNA